MFNFFLHLIMLLLIYKFMNKNENYINKLQNKFGDVYDYSLVNYKNPKSNIILICKKHGKFIQRSDYLLKNGGCKNCKRDEIQSRLITKAKIIHNNKYNYDKVMYLNANKKVDIICPKHGIFKQTLQNHSNGQGCPKCMHEQKYLTNDQFIQQAKEIFGNIYDYSLVNYIDSKTNIKIICKIHNEIFETTPQKFIYNKIGCKKCSIEKIRSNTDEFVKKAIKIHGNVYDYSKVKYINSRIKVIIICNKHGEFEQLPNLHLHKETGCPHCRRSIGEENVQKYLECNNIRFENQKRFEDCRNKYALPFDFYLSELNTCIEFDGVQHYIPNEYFGGQEGLEQRQNNDKIKTDYCKNNGIKLIRIKYDEDIDFMLNKFLI